MWKREKEGEDFWLLISFFFFVILRTIWDIFSIKILLLYAWCMTMKMQLFHQYSEVLDGWFLHHNFHVFIALWSVSAPAVCHVTLLPCLFSLFFLVSCERRSMLPAALTLPALGNEKFLFYLPSPWRTQTVMLSERYKTVSSPCSLFGNLTIKILSGWHPKSSQVLWKHFFVFPRKKLSFVTCPS